MGILIAIILLLLSVAIFVAVRKKWISNESLQTLANIAGVVALLAAIIVFIVPTPGTLESNDTTEISSENTLSIATPTSDVQSLQISFDPNPVYPTIEYDEKWIYIWEFTFNVKNPNDFAVEIVAFGDYNECLFDMDSCSNSAREFAMWFTGCGSGNPIIPPQGLSCDKSYWYRQDWAPENEMIGKYAIYFRDENGEIHQAISEELIFKNP